MLARAVTDRFPDYQPAPSTCFCEERSQFLYEFLSAVHELTLLHTQQTQAVIGGDRDFGRFDILIYLAQERKDAAKYAWISHAETHRCEEEMCT
jgi:hypothetical protein